MTQSSGKSRRENAGARLEQRHCEERSDEAIHSFFTRLDGLLRFARNDAEGRSHLRYYPFRRIASGVSGCASGCAVANSGIAIEVS